MKVNINTSVDDLLSSFRYSLDDYAVADLEHAIKEETAGQNRKTIIKLLNRAIRDKKNGARRL